MKKAYLILMVIGFSVILFYGGVLYGFKKGVANTYILESIVKGVLGFQNIKMYEINGFENHLFAYELDVDSAIWGYLEYQEFSALDRKLSEGFLYLDNQRIKDYIERIIEWRKGHPVVFNCDWVENYKEKEEYSGFYSGEKKSCEESREKLVEFLSEHGALINASTRAPRQNAER